MNIAKTLNTIREKLEKLEKSLLSATGKLNSSLISRGIKSLDILNKFLKISRARKELTIILTHKCNLSCAYCLRGANPDYQAEIPYPELKKIIASAYQFGIRNAGITGGEPFLYSHWKELVEFLGNLKWHILWETNGQLINEKSLQFIKENLGDNVTFLVSLDSYKQEIHDKLRGKGSFGKAIMAIKLIKSYNFSLQTNAVLTPLNMMNEGDLIDYINFNKNLGVNCANLNRVVSLGRGSDQKIFSLSDEQMTKLRFLFKKYNNFDGYLKDGAFRLVEDDVGCERLGSEICISPFGIHPCIFHEDIKLGELQDFKKLFFNQVFLKTLNILRLASIADYKGGYFSCTGCMESLPNYLRAVKQLELLGDGKSPKTKKEESYIYDIVLPRSFSVLLTQKCNLNCDFCEFECSPEREASININDFEKLLYEGKNIGISEIIFDGGEPLVHNDIRKAMQLCYRYGYDVTVLTNGCHFEDYLPEFQKYNIKKFIFGINGATAKTNDFIMGKDGTFKRQVKAIKKSKKLGFFTGLHLVIHPLNVKELDRFFELAKKWKIDYIMTSRIIEVGRAKDNPGIKIIPGQIEEVKKVYEKHKDFLGKIQFYGAYLDEERALGCKYLARDGHLSVHWDGQIALCSMTPLLDLPFGKIRDYSLLECLAAMNKANQKFQEDCNKEFSGWRLPENPYFHCEYCHQKLIGEERKYFAD